MRYAEYCQQLDRLTLSVDDIKSVLDSKPVRYAYLIHDKDKHEDGSSKADHIHVMIDFKGTSQTAENVSKWFNDKPERIEKAKTKMNRFVYENMCSYLIHETETSDGKYHYDDDAVVANFDFCSFMNEVRSGVKNAKNKKKMHPLSDVLTLIMNNEIPRIKLTEYICDLDNLKYRKDIETAYKIRDEKLRKVIDRNMNVMYFYGPAGSGKTTWAKTIANRKGYSVFVSGSSNDPLEGYLGQECVILDDIRGSDWKINDLLKMLDNNTNSLVKSRYSNKLLIDCKLMILTSVQSLTDLYSSLKDRDNEPIEQLKRRCTDLVKFSHSTISLFTYNPKDSSNYDGYVHVGDIPNMTAQILYCAEHRDSMIQDLIDLTDALSNEPW